MHYPNEPFMEDHRAETAYIHESSYVDTPCRIGEHTTILHFSHVMANSMIGSFCIIGRNVTIASGVLLGDHVKVMNNAQLNSGVILEDNVFCGQGAVFAENRHIRAQTQSVSRVTPTLVRRGAQIGPNSTIANGFTIGAHAFVEAGTIVDRNIPDFAVVYGNPLKFAGWRCECGQIFSNPAASKNDDLACSYCNRRYSRQSRWKLLPLTQGIATYDSDSELDPSVRKAQRPD